jgi:hypothetical protein
MMRKAIFAISVAAVAALATPALAQPYGYESGGYAPDYVAPVAGAAVGTAVGVGLADGWFGSGVFVASLPADAAGAAAVGGVAGVGTVALVDAVIEPCRGFHALLGMNRDQCVNGEWVGNAPRRRISRR